MTIDQGIALAFKWLRTGCSLALGGFLALTLLKLYGFSFLSIPTIGWQELGVFVAGTAYAIRNL